MSLRLILWLRFVHAHQHATHHDGSLFAYLPEFLKCFLMSCVPVCKNYLKNDIDKIHVATEGVLSEGYMVVCFFVRIRSCIKTCPITRHSLQTWQKMAKLSRVLHGYYISNYPTGAHEFFIVRIRSYKYSQYDLHKCFFDNLNLFKKQNPDIFQIRKTLDIPLEVPHHPLQSIISPSSKYNITLFKVSYHHLQSTTSPSSKYHITIFKV